MTNGTITSSTYATESDGTYPVTVSANRFLLPEQGTFVIAYEVHLNETQLDSTDPFLCYIALDKSNGVNNRTYTKFFNGYPSATPEGSHYETKSGMLFDDQMMGFYNTRASGSPVLSFRFKNGRSEWLNYYALGASDPEHSYPTSWTVYGSNDEETWDALDTQTGNVFVSTFTFNYFPFRNNTKSYRSYRMDVHSCRHSSICLVSEWYGFSGNVIPPTIFYYPEPSYTLVKNIDYIDITPVCDAADATYSIYPALPGGLHLNTTTGSITGTITSTPSTTQYIVTATNSAGYRRIALYINVIILYCNADGKWPKTEYTRTVRMTCGSYDYEGLKSRYCDYADGRAVWQDVVDGCVLKLPVIFYSPTAYTFYVDLPITTLIPIVQYRVESFSIDRELPEGLYFDPTNGYISGTPLVTSPVLEYTITATNARGSTNTTISFGVTICNSSTHSVVRFMKINTLWFSEEAYVVSDKNGDLYYSLPFQNVTNQYIYYCFPTGIIHIQLIDSYEDGWSDGSKLYIQMDDKENDYFSIAAIYNRAYSTNSFSFDISYKIPPHSSQWTYSTDLVPNWYGVEPVSGFSPFDVTNPPESEGHNIWLFRTTVSLNPTSYNGFELRVKARAGYIIYINGIEYYRKNLPTGDLTADTVATSSEDLTTYRYISGPNSKLVNGTNTIAIGIINLIDNNPSTLLFDCTLQQMMPNDIGRPFSIIATASTYGSNFKHINDHNHSTVWYAEQPNKADFIINYNCGVHRADHFNKYCITSSSMSDVYDPSDWSIYGTNDGETFELIDSVANTYFFERTVIRCFYMPTNTKPYTDYRMIVTENALPTRSPYGLSIAELAYSMIDPDILVIPRFALYPSTFTGYVGAAMPLVNPSSDLFTNYSISPPLPYPLELDTSIGSIRGIPIETSPVTQYNVTARTPKNDIVSTTITFGIEECLYPNDIIVLKTWFPGDATGVSWSITTPSGTILDNSMAVLSYAAQTFLYCQPPGTYSVTFSNGGGSSGKYYIYSRGGSSPIEHGPISHGSTKVKADIGYIVPPYHTLWYYLLDGSTPPPDWYTSSSSHRHWDCAYPDYFPLPRPEAITQYYSTDFIIDDIDYVHNSAVKIVVKSYAGIVVYLNGFEIFRANLPEGPIDPSTPATGSFDIFEEYVITIPIDSPYINNGPNILSSEIHKKDDTVEPNDYQGYIEYVGNGSYRVTDGYPWSDIPTTGIHGMDKVFDNDGDTFVSSGPRCEGAIYQWTYNNYRREYINHYKITSTRSCNMFHPSGWLIEASNDGTNWTLLYGVTNQYFTEYSQTFSFDFYSPTSYNMYRFTATECNNSAIINSSGNNCGTDPDPEFRLSEIGLYVKNVTVSCDAEGEWGPAPEDGYAFLRCPERAIRGFRRRYCLGGVFREEDNYCVYDPSDIPSYPNSTYHFYKNVEITTLIPSGGGPMDSFTITPSLPSGLIFNSTNGYISGTPYAPSPSTKYTVTGSYSNETFIIIIHIQVDILYCEPDGDWSRTEYMLSVTLPCNSTYYEGHKKRYCDYINGVSVWRDVVNTCRLKAPIIHYPQSSYPFYKDVDVGPIIPTIGNRIDSITIIGNLPDGLSFNSTTGIISGVPRDDFPPTEYVIIASNPEKSTNVTITISVSEVVCPYGTIPTLFVKHAFDDQLYQCFSIVSDINGVDIYHGDCPNNGVEGTYSDWFEETHELSFYYKCLYPGIYHLHVTSFERTSNHTHGDSWNGGSYLTITTLPYTDGNNTVIPERSVGHYYYSKSCDGDGNGEDENIIIINIGPVVCRPSEQVVIFEKFSTIDANLEGFDIYRFENSQFVLVYSFYGQAAFNSGSMDPYTKSIICLSHAYYKIVLRHKAVIETDHSIRECSGWSTHESIEYIEYTDLNEVRVFRPHPSFLRITVLESSTYNYEINSSVYLTVEGENFAVFRSDRIHISTPFNLGIPETDIYSPTDCHYDIFLTVSSSEASVDFIIKNEHEHYVEGTLISVDYGSKAVIDVNCDENSTPGSCDAIAGYTVECYPTIDNAQSCTNSMNCHNYGLEHSVVTSSTLEFRGTYRTPNVQRANVYMRVTSVIGDEHKETYTPDTKIVRLAIEVALCENGVNFVGDQYSDICINKETQLEGSCWLRGIELPENSFATRRSIDCDGVYIRFTVGNLIPFNCTFGAHNYHIYVKPVNLYSQLPPHMSISQSDTIYTENCSAESAKEVYSVFNPFSLKIDQISHITTCHQNIFNSAQNKPPRGHSYINVVFEIVTNGDFDDYNAAPSTTWFKQELEYAISEVSHVPVRDIYVTEFSYSANSKSNTLVVIIDTAYEYGRDFMLQFTENSELVSDFVSEINQKLLVVYSVYWSKHSLEASSYDIEMFENYCRSHTDDLIEFSYIDEMEVSHTVEMYDVTFGATILWYYSYVTATESAEYSFTGAITRYARPKYYEAVFMEYTAHTQAQLIDAPWNDVHFILLIENQDPRGANADVRYSVARSMARTLNNDAVRSGHDIETFDVNVYMVEGDTPVAPEDQEGDAKFEIFQNTKFYIEVRVRDGIQKNRFIEHLNTHIIADIETGYIDEEIEADFLHNMNWILGEGYRIENKNVRLLNVMQA